MAGDEIEKRIGHRFADTTLRDAALTHASVGGPVTYERLEFLGDRVLGLIVSQWLYAVFPREAEGCLAKRLAALVEGTHLAALAQDLDLGPHIRLSEAERAAGGAENPHILADVLEALIGALYLDAGLEAAERFVRGAMGEAITKTMEPPQHPKTALQEWAQARGLPLPAYAVVGRHGPDHAPHFIVRVAVEGLGEAEGEGANRQAAERAAAQSLLPALGALRED
ncbi:MAG TPA: ribonuclease III [Rhodospirillaceae bacterium]|jgi:ribonuclease-3|nr:ribonuclease III [Alphaproteobacteria bacterium]HBH27173.1 ribonuclease III [Rhodospirillaceae bacterium]